MFIEYGGRAPRVAASAFVAPNATLIGDVTVGEEASIWFGVVLRADRGMIRIGAGSSVEDNAIVHASSGQAAIVGNDVTIGHGAVLDDCTVGDGALVGSNAVILAGATIGAGCIVGAGSVVTTDERLPAGTVAAGAPARVRKAVAATTAERVAQTMSLSRTQGQAYRRDNIGDPARHELKSTSRRKRGAALATT